MTVMYMQMVHEHYKGIEKQMTEFKETVHKTTGGFYHKSIRIRIDNDTVIEFHGPIVKAAEEYVEDEGNDFYNIDRYLEKAAKYQLTPAEFWVQRVDYAHANLRILDQSISREMIEKRATKMFGPRPKTE